MRRMEPTPMATATMVLLGLFLAVPDQTIAQKVQGRTVSNSVSRGLTAMDTAAQKGKYLFFFFWKENGQEVTSTYSAFQNATRNLADQADAVAIQVTDPNEKAVVDKFGVSRAPMPLVLAVAPNGAVTKGLPIRFTEEQLRDAIVSPCTAQCMKALQDRKLVLLCVQSEGTQFNNAAWQGVQQFKADTRFAKATEVVALNPSDGREASFLQALQVNPQTSQAVTVLLAPPGKPIAHFTGAVTKDQIVAKVEAGPCAGGQCGPGGCCGPKQ